MTQKVVIYHADCPDGFSGAYAAWKKFKGQALYFPLFYNTGFPSEVNDSEVYIIDFSFEEKDMRELLKKAQRVVALDHHFSAKESTKMAHEHVFRNDNSGCVIAWNYFHHGKPVPRLLLHVEDFDLWKFSLKHTKEIDAFLGLVRYDFTTWDKVVNDCEDDEKLENIIERGKDLLKYKTMMIDKLVKDAYLVKFSGYETLAVNSKLFRSEIGNRLVQIKPPISIIWSEAEDNYRVSLRSDGKVDVSKLAEKYGGKGHVAAAGFTVPIGKPLPWKRIKK